MPETFRTLRVRDVGTSRTQLQTAAGVNYAVPAGGVALIIGMTVCNDTGAAISATIETGQTGAFNRLCLNTSINPGQTLAPVGEMNKIGLEAGEGVYVTSSAAASADAVCTILEITP
jgi:hypothetical protein